MNDGAAVLVSEVVLGAKEMRPSEVGVLTSRDGDGADDAGMAENVHNGRWRLRRCWMFHHLSLSTLSLTWLIDPSTRLFTKRTLMSVR